MSRPPDLSFEALAAETNTNWNTGRGALNKSLALIREEMPNVDDTELATEIVYRAKLYRERYPSAPLTPTALAKHWYRVLAESKPPPSPTLQPTTKCPTCQGDKFVMVSKRPAPAAGMFFEEYAACPDCNTAADGSYYLKDGSRFVPPDPDRVREMMDS